MLINYTPSEKTKAKIKYIKFLREQGNTFRSISNQMNISQQYIVGLLQWDRENSVKPVEGGEKA